jgi:hypothetical protein
LIKSGNVGQTNQLEKGSFFLMTHNVSLGLDTIHLKLRGLKLQWFFEKGWIMMSITQIH